MKRRFDNTMQQPLITLSGDDDQLFSQPGYPLPFAFTSEVARVFDDMISRSVPFYGEVIRVMCQWLASHPPRESQRIYDVGCSTGTSLYALAAILTSPGHLVGIDTSPAMLERARAKLSPLADRHTIELRCEGAQDADYTAAHMVLVNYTLQFIPLTERLEVLTSIYQGLQPGGMLFLSEKLNSPHPTIHDTFTRHYEEFKHHAGYSSGEIQRKKAALDRVLIPLSLDEQCTMLKTAGFTAVEIVVKWQNFATLLALKD